MANTPGTEGNRSTIAPQDMFPERVSNVFERTIAPDRSGGRGPLRFEEGLGTDTDAPDNFVMGAMQGYRTPPGRPNHNENVYEKYPEETMRERAHVGSASWVEAPTYLSEFAQGTTAGNPGYYLYEEVERNGGRYERHNPAEVTD
jgi:hypothetical protein